jgi:hypothetical protein
MVLDRITKAGNATVRTAQYEIEFKGGTLYHDYNVPITL